MLRLLRKIVLYSRWLFQWPMFVLRKSAVSFTTRVEPRAVLVNSKIGKYCYIGGEVYLNCVVMGNYCSIASGVKVGGMEHSWWWGSTSAMLSRYNIYDKITIVEDDVWIAANAVIRQGVKIGRGAVIGAGAVVLRDVPPYAIVAGVPAKLIKMRFPDEVVREILNTNFWLFPPVRAARLLESIDYSSPPDYAKDMMESKS